MPGAGREYHLSRHATSHPLTGDTVAMWNSYFPNVIVLGRDLADRLSRLPDTADLDHHVLGRLRRHRIIYRGPEDPYQAEFFTSADKVLREVDNEAQAFHRGLRSYSHLTIVNSGCNLGCSYCVSYHGDEHRQSATRIAIKGAPRTDLVLDVVDQYVRRKRDLGEDSIPLGFNGGEILLQWPLVERILDHVSTHYSDMKLSAHMNTNATLLTDDIARKLAAFKVDIDVSIDGYESIHDQSRHYHTGGGSFDRVLEGMAAYTRHSGESFTDFQGTIQDVSEFDEGEFNKMADRGFKYARLAPNLLDKPADYGQVAAYWEAASTVASQDRPVHIVKSQFEKLSKRISSGKGFKFHCNGLSGLKARTLTLNVESMQLSQMCSFVSPASVPLSELGADIYNTKLWDATRAYIVSRVNQLRTACSGCEVIGVCQGSCVYNGLDLANRRHSAACNYQRSMWRHAVDFAFSGEVRQLEDFHPEGETNEPTRGCSSTDPLRQTGVWKLTPVAS